MNFPAFITKTGSHIFLHSRVLLLSKTWTISRCFFFLFTIHEACCREFTHYCRSRGKFTALFLADNARKLAVIPTVEMCQLLMGLSIEMAFPEDLREIDIVVLTVTLQTPGSHTVTYQSGAASPHISHFSSVHLKPPSSALTWIILWLYKWENTWIVFIINLPVRPTPLLILQICNSCL